MHRVRCFQSWTFDGSSGRFYFKCNRIIRPHRLFWDDVIDWNCLGKKGSDYQPIQLVGGQTYFRKWCSKADEPRFELSLVRAGVDRWKHQSIVSSAHWTIVLHINLLELQLIDYWLVDCPTQLIFIWISICQQKNTKAIAMHCRAICYYLMRPEFNGGAILIGSVLGNRWCCAVRCCLLNKQCL